METQNGAQSAQTTRLDNDRSPYDCRDGMTKEALSLLRRADELVIHHDDDGNHIGAIKRGRYNDPFDHDTRVEIDIEGNGGTGDFSYLPRIEGIIGMLKVGDIVSAQWSAGGWTTENHKNNGMVADGLEIHVRRGKHSFPFLVDVRTVPIGSLARMCKRN